LSKEGVFTMKKLSLLVLVFTLITLVLAFTSCGAQAEAEPVAASANKTTVASEQDLTSVLDQITNKIAAGDVGGALGVVGSAFGTSAGVVGGVAAVVYFLICLGLSFVGIWLLI
jgi:hypothetical protein